MKGEGRRFLAEVIKSRMFWSIKQHDVYKGLNEVQST